MRRPLLVLTLVLLLGGALALPGNALPGNALAGNALPGAALAGARVPDGPAARATSSARPAAAAAPRYANEPPRGVSCRPGGSRVTLRCEVARSLRGRSIVATRAGPADAPRVLLVLGQMHGNEWPGPLVVRTIRRLAVPEGVQVWTVSTMNPDGRARGSRHNARGVDLNRNFGTSWRVQPYSGSRPWSEPATRGIRRLLRWVQPDAVVSLHGFSESVDTTGGGKRTRLAREFSRLSGIGPAQPVPCGGGHCHGTMTEWYTTTSRVGGAAFTVEMPRSSRQDRACPVRDGRRIPVIRCAARASLALASRELVPTRSAFGP